MERGGDPAEIIARLDLAKAADSGALEPVIEKIVGANPDKVKSYREGKKNLLGFFVGQVMRETQNSADPALTRALLEKKLEA